MNIPIIHSRSFKPVLALLIIFSSFTITLASSQLHDEALIFSTYLGGELADRPASIAIDGQGNAYITGVTQSVVFPTQSSHLAAEHGLDVFIAKISPDGKDLLYVLWIDAVNASDVDEGVGIAVDERGNAYVTGHTRSPDFCTFYGQVPGYEKTYQGDGDAFLLKIKPDGSGLDYCTFIGGSDWDSGSAVIIDSDGNATITGGTWSDDFPISDNAASEENTGQRDIFITTLNAAGTSLLYSTYLGGFGQEQGRDLTRVGTTRIAVAGWTNSPNFPTKPGAYELSNRGGFDAFLAQIDINSGEQTYGSYLGGDGEDRAAAIAATANGQLLIAGSVAVTPNTPNPTFPTTPGALKTELSGESDAFLVKFNTQASGLAYSTLIGGDGQEQGLGLSINNQNAFAISGSTNSANFPTTGQAFQLKHKGPKNTSDAFISQFSPESDLIYSSYFGGDEEDSGRAIVLTNSEELYLTGSSRSDNLPISEAAISNENQGDYDVYITRLLLPPPVEFQIHLPLVLLD